MSIIVTDKMIAFINKLADWKIKPAEDPYGSLVSIIDEAIDLQYLLSNPPRTGPQTQADNQDPATVAQSNGNPVDRQNGPNDTGMRSKGNIGDARNGKRRI